MLCMIICGGHVKKNGRQPPCVIISVVQFYRYEDVDLFNEEKQQFLSTLRKYATKHTPNCTKNEINTKQQIIEW